MASTYIFLHQKMKGGLWGGKTAVS